MSMHAYAQVCMHTWERSTPVTVHAKRRPMKTFLHESSSVQFSLISATDMSLINAMVVLPKQEHKSRNLQPPGTSAPN